MGGHPRQVRRDGGSPVFAGTAVDGRHQGSPLQATVSASHIHSVSNSYTVCRWPRSVKRALKGRGRLPTCRRRSVPSGGSVAGCGDWSRGAARCCPRRGAADLRSWSIGMLPLNQDPWQSRSRRRTGSWPALTAPSLHGSLNRPEVGRGRAAGPDGPYAPTCTEPSAAMDLRHDRDVAAGPTGARSDSRQVDSPSVGGDGGSNGRHPARKGSAMTCGAIPVRPPWRPGPRPPGRVGWPRATPLGGVVGARMDGHASRCSREQDHHR
jgi:hypothetical protein